MTAPRIVGLRSSAALGRGVTVAHEAVPVCGREWSVTFCGQGFAPTLSRFRTLTGAQIAADAYLKGRPLGACVEAGWGHDHAAAVADAHEATR